MDIYYSADLPRGVFLKSAFARAGYDFDETLLRTTPNGKPYFPSPSAPKFNLTHTQDFIAVAIGNAEVGLDAERKRPRKTEALRLRFSPPECNEDFWEVWTAKEAYVKFCGETLAAKLSALAYYGGTLYENGLPVKAQLRHYTIGGCVLCLCTQPSEPVRVIAELFD